MDRTISYEMTDELAVRSLHRNMGFKNYLKVVLVVGVVGSFVVAVAFGFGKVPGRTALIVLAVLFLLGSLFYRHAFLLSKTAILASLAKVPNRIQVFQFHDGGVIAGGALGESRLTWDMLEKVEHFPDLWHLHFISLCYLLPAELVDPELGDFLENKARERGLQILRGRFIDPPDRKKR